MKTHFNNNEYAKKMAQKMQQLATCLPPVILFEKSDKKTSKSEEDKDKFKTFDIKMNKKEKDSEKIEVSVKLFENGIPEDFCKWYEQYVEVKEWCLWTLIKVIYSILKDSYLETFNSHLEDVQQPEEDGETDDITEDNIEDALEKVTLKASKNDHHAYRHQLRYMRHQLYFTTSNFSSFLHRLKQLNKYLKYFPIPPQQEHVHTISDKELVEIIDNAKPLEYNQYMLQNNYDLYENTLQEFCQHI